MRKRSPEKVIAALLTHDTEALAAAALGVTPGTVSRWLAEPELRDAYLAARRRVVDGAVLVLQKAADKAARKLQSLLDCEDSDNVQLRAAVAVLDQSFRAMELTDLAAKVAEIERLLREHNLTASGGSALGPAQASRSRRSKTA